MGGKRWKTSLPHNEPLRIRKLTASLTQMAAVPDIYCSLRTNKSVLLSSTICLISWTLAFLWMIVCRIYIMVFDFSLFVTLPWRLNNAQNREQEPHLLYADRGPCKRCSTPRLASLRIVPWVATLVSQSTSARPLLAPVIYVHMSST